MKWPQRWVAAYVVTLPAGEGKGNPLGNGTFPASFYFAGVYFFPCEISELPRPIATKLPHMMLSVFDVIISVQNIGRGHFKNN